MKCINCNNEAIGRSKYCSAKCKVAYNRNNRNTKSVTSESVTQTVTPTYQDVACKAKGITVNHGQWKPMGKLGDHEVNAVCVPGDGGYCGCMKGEDPQGGGPCL